MSHFTSVKTKIKNQICLIRALKDLGYEVNVAEEHQSVQVRGYQGQKADGIMAIKASKTYDIGVKVGPGETLATYRVDEPEDVGAALKYLLDARAAT